MLGVTFIFVGKTRESYYNEAQREYIKRLRPFCVAEIVEIQERRTPDNPSTAQISAALMAEAADILKRVPPDAYTIPLCVEGGAKSSEELAILLETLPINGISKICFVIGGSFGLHESVKERGRLRLSLSKMTLPHSLARVVLLEQVYRAFSISAGSKYHK